MSAPVDSKYNSKELNVYYANTSARMVLKDTTGQANGLAPSTNVMSLALDYNGSSTAHAFLIPELMIHDTDGYAFGLAYSIKTIKDTATALNATVVQELKDRKSADDVLTANLALEVTARGNADSVHTGAIAQEVYDRGAGDLANTNAITQEVADRKAAILVVSNSAASNALAIAAEAKSRTESDGLLTASVSTEKNRAELAEYGLNNAIQGEIGDRGAAVSVVSAAVVAEAKLAREEEAKLGARIDFITSNSNPAAIDSLSEIVSQFSANGMGYADRLTYLEGVIAALVNQHQ